jgi:hypothetical protein
MGIMAIVILGQMIYLFRVERRVSFNEGRMQEVSAWRNVLEKLVAQSSSMPAPKPASANAALSETDGPEFRPPAKSLKPDTAPHEQKASQGKKAASAAQPRANKKHTEKTAKKPAADKADAKTSTTPASNEPKPERTPR